MNLETISKYQEFEVEKEFVVEDLETGENKVVEAYASLVVEDIEGSDITVRVLDRRAFTIRMDIADLKKYVLDREMPVDDIEFLKGLVGKNFEVIGGIHIEVGVVDPGMVSHTPWYAYEGDEVCVVEGEKEQDFYIVNKDLDSSRTEFEFFGDDPLYVDAYDMMKSVVPNLKGVR